MRSKLILLSCVLFCFLASQLFLMAEGVFVLTMVDVKVVLKFFKVNLSLISLLFSSLSSHHLLPILLYHLYCPQNEA